MNTTDISRVFPQSRRMFCERKKIQVCQFSGFNMKYVSVSHLVSHTADMLLLIDENKIKKYKPLAGSIQSMLSQPISFI
jgi:hypothetical protein